MYGNWAEQFTNEVKEYVNCQLGNHNQIAENLVESGKEAAIIYGKGILSNDELKNPDNSEMKVTKISYSRNGNLTELQQPTKNYTDGLKVMYTIHELLANGLSKTLDDSIGVPETNILLFKLEVVFKIYIELRQKIHICENCEGVEGCMSYKYLLHNLITITTRINERLQLLITAGFVEPALLVRLVNTSQYIAQLHLRLVNMNDGFVCSVEHTTL